MPRSAGDAGASPARRGPAAGAPITCRAGTSGSRDRDSRRARPAGPTRRFPPQPLACGRKRGLTFRARRRGHARGGAIDGVGSDVAIKGAAGRAAVAVDRAGWPGAGATSPGPVSRDHAGPAAPASMNGHAGDGGRRVWAAAAGGRPARHSAPGVAGVRARPLPTGCGFRQTKPCRARARPEGPRAIP